MANQDTVAKTDDDMDIGFFLDVPEEQRSEVDPSPEYNADAGFDINVVPDGVYVELSTADPKEPMGDKRFDDDGDGAPLSFLDPNDPEVF